MRSAWPPLDSSSALLLAMTKELPLPVADAPRPAGPDLNPRVEGLRVQRIAVPSRQPGSNCGARLLRPYMCDPGFGNHDPFGLDDLGIGHPLRASALASAIGLCLDLDRREFGSRPERLRRKQRLGKIEAKELVGTIFIRDRSAAPCQQRRTDHGEANIFQDHSKPPEIRENGNNISSRKRDARFQPIFRRYRPPILPGSRDVVVA